MYAARRTYVKNWEHQGPEEQTLISVKGGKGKLIDPKRITYITEEIAYWRKANQIHSWFVENVQNGNDDCGTYDVTGAQLRDLVDLCKLVLASSHLVDGKIQNGQKLENGEWVPVLQDGQKIEGKTVAETLLPTSSGFFFGSQDYDEYYYQDLKNTVEQLEPVLAEDPDGEFTYHSSW